MICKEHLITEVDCFHFLVGFDCPLRFLALVCLHMRLVLWQFQKRFEACFLQAQHGDFLERTIQFISSNFRFGAALRTLIH